MVKKIFFYLFGFILLFHSSLGVGLSQTKPLGDSVAEIKLEKITFLVREIEAAPSNMKLLEIQIEVFNRSRKSAVPPDSMKLMVMPKEIKLADEKGGKTFSLSPEETTLPLLPPYSGRLMIIGFPLPKEKLESITFELQINPPEGDKKTVTWSGS